MPEISMGFHLTTAVQVWAFSSPSDPQPPSTFDPDFA